jgi:serine protease
MYRCSSDIEFALRTGNLLKPTAMHKHTYAHLVHFLILLVCGMQLMSAQTDLNVVSIDVGGRKTSVVQQRLIVRMWTARDIASAQQSLPPGVRVIDQLLRPDQTTFFSDRARLQRSMPSESQDLYSAEDRLTRTFVLEYTSVASPLHMSALLLTKHGGHLEISEPWYVAQTQEVPNDPDVAVQYHLQTIRAQQAWDAYQGSESVIICVSDDGVRQDHEDLAPNIAINDKEIPDNLIDDDGNGYIDDHTGYNFAYLLDGTQPGSTMSITSFGHGTKVAGLAAAATNNGKGIAGVGYKSKLFPLKTSKKSGGGILFGYQSLIYAAQRKFPIVNTSWGVVKPFSQIDQSVIDYCIASNVMVVSSGGNHGADEVGAAWRWVNFPSGYRGVCGVGETTVDDQVTQTSGVGVNADVYAPGYLAYTTDSPSGYTSFGIMGTSFASPIVAGLAGLVRGKWPNLSPMQVAEHIRQTSDDISFVNMPISEFRPRRVNAERALTTEPFSRPGVRITASTVRVARTGEERYRVGDTIELVLRLTNYLADVNLETVLYINDLNGWSLRILNDAQTLGLIQQNGVKTMQPIKIVVDAIGAGDCVLGLTMSGPPAYDDRDVVMISPPTTMYRFENDKLIYSLSDDGMVGYSAPFDPKYGDGFGFKPTYSMLASGGIFAQMQSTVSVSAYKNDPPYASDFVASKQFGRNPGANVGVMSDSAAVQPIGIEVQQQCLFPSQTAQATVWNVTVRPSSEISTLSNIGVGYVFDWDLGSGGSDNRIVHDDSCIPASLRGGQTAAFIVSRDAFPLAVCVAAVSARPADVAQAACMMLEDIIDDGDGFTSADRIRLLTSGTSITTDAVGDVAGSIGMLTNGDVSAGNPLSFRVIIGAGNSPDDARRAVREAIEATTSVQEGAKLGAAVWPNPTDGDVQIRSANGSARCEIVDVAGRVIISEKLSSDETRLRTTTLASGVYRVVFYDAYDRLLHVETLVCK